MTTNELEGRALAEAAARAMGWTDDGTDWFDARRVWRDCSGETPHITERECLAWLANAAYKSKGDVCVNVTFSHEKSYVLFADMNREGECGVDYAYERVGMRPGFHPEDDLLEALQRLVVAVAAREVKQ